MSEIAILDVFEGIPDHRLMLGHKPLHLDLTQSTSPSQILPCKPSLSSHIANWNGIILRQYSQLPPHGFPEYYPQQHLIIIH